MSKQIISLVTENRRDLLPTGVLRRLEQLEWAYSAKGFTVRHEVLLDTTPRTMRALIAEAEKSVSDLRIRDRHLVFVALGSAPVVAACYQLSKVSLAFSVDLCDSMVLQLFAAMSSRQPRQFVWAIYRAWRLFTLRRDIMFTYISDRDRVFDNPFLRRRPTTTIAPRLPAALMLLGDVDTSSLSRIVISGDFGSPHLARGLHNFFKARRAGGSLPVHMYGPERPPKSFALGPNMEYLGFSPSLEALYVGNSVVFVPNVGGAGVPNKLLEAIASKRPVIVHESMISRVPFSFLGWSYRTKSDLRRILGQVDSGLLPQIIASPAR